LDFLASILAVYLRFKFVHFHLIPFI